MAAVLVVIVVLPFVALDVTHPRDRIVNGGTIWHCVSVGGSWPVEAGALVGLTDGMRIERIGAVSAQHVWVSVVAVSQPGRSSTRETAFLLGDRAGSRLGALDSEARGVAQIHSTDSRSSHRREIRAARECLRRRLP
jgi:hypothetical protein